MKSFVYLAIFFPLSRETSLRIWKYDHQKGLGSRSQIRTTPKPQPYLIKGSIFKSNFWLGYSELQFPGIYTTISAKTFEELCCIFPSFVHFHGKDADIQLTTLEHPGLNISAQVQDRTIISEVFCSPNLSDSKWLKPCFITGYVN